MLAPVGYYDVEIIRNGEIVLHIEGKNTITNEGLQHLLNRVFRGPATVALEPALEEECADGWFIGYIKEKTDHSPTTTSVDDTGQVHDFELFTDIPWIQDVTTLPVWTPSIIQTTYKNDTLYNAARNKVYVAAGTQKLIGFCVKQNGLRSVFVNQDPGPPYANHWAVLWAVALFNHDPIEVQEGDIISTRYIIRLTQED